MDIYGLADSVIIVLATLSALKVKSREGLLLLSFFALTAVISATLELSGLMAHWLGLFTFICVVYGSASYRHPIVLGYAACLFIIGLEAARGFEYYSQSIFIIYLYQLWIVTYGQNNGRYSRSVRIYRSRFPSRKVMAKKEST